MLYLSVYQRGRIGFDVGEPETEIHPVDEFPGERLEQDVQGRAISETRMVELRAVVVKE